MPTLHAGTNFVLHAAGWMEGGLASSYEKFVMDCDQLGMMHVLAKGIDLSENGQAHGGLPRGRRRAAISSAARHTQANFETAFYRSSIADNNSVEQWEAEGRLDAPQRANKHLEEDAGRVRGRRRIDPGIDEALRDYIERKKASMPDATH